MKPGGGGGCLQLLARELDVAATNVTKADKAEHIKRNRHRPPQTSTGNAAPQAQQRRLCCETQRRADALSGCVAPGVGPGSIARGFMAQNLGTEEPRIIRMAQQVKDVLPHVPLNVIARDLGTSRVCVYI